MCSIGRQREGEEQDLTFKNHANLCGERQKGESVMEIKARSFPHLGVAEC